MDLNEVGLPRPIGLYNPENEKDACGVGFIVSIDGIASHNVVLQSRKILTRMAHRGSCTGDGCTGDGAGVLTSIPHSLFLQELK
jgi:glutamate synthase domain-containing protein 1